VLPPFDPITGRLPPGEHEATWDEVVERFGWNDRRRRLIDGLADALAILSEAGIGPAWIPTRSTRCCSTCPVVVKRRRSGSVANPNVTEAGSGLVFSDFFQNDRVTGRKGIVVIAVPSRFGTQGGWT
jgi:hypothetical protein